MMFKNIDRVMVACMRILDPEAGENEDGWTRIGALCSSRRRSAWMRLHRTEDNHGYDSAATVEWIEICGGREGDDFEMIIDHENPQFEELLDLFTLMRWCADT